MTAIFDPNGPIIIKKENVHAAARNILFSWLIFLLSANLQHLCLGNNRFFRCLPTSDTCVRKTCQILGVNPPMIHYKQFLKIVGYCFFSYSFGTRNPDISSIFFLFSSTHIDNRTLDCLKIMCDCQSLKSGIKRNISLKT